MVSEATIAEAADLLLRAVPRGKVILFGSYARGDADEGSDVDFLVIAPEVKDRLEETQRLTELLRPLRIPADVIVATQSQFEYWSDTPGTVYYEAAIEGKVFETLARTG